MRLLIVSPVKPFPPRDGATIRVFNLIKELSTHFEIDLVTVVRDNVEAADLKGLNQYCDRICPVLIPRSRIQKLKDELLSPFRRWPYMATINWSKDLKLAVQHFASQADIILSEFPYGATCVPSEHPYQVLDQHNIEYEILKRQWALAANPLRWIFDYQQYRKMKSFEKEFCSRATFILATSKRDADVLSKFNPKVLVVPNGIPRLHSRIPVREPIVTFLGLMSYPANEDAVHFFLDEIWPSVIAAVPNAHFQVIGRMPSQRLLRRSTDKIEFTGEVTSTTEYMQQTCVFVAPLRIGSGTRIKIIEAMSHGLPIVSTQIGCEGLAVRNGEHLRISDKPAEFAKNVSELLLDAPARASLGKNAQELVEEKYLWNQIAKDLASALHAGIPA